jgi:predicted Fe-Mo cluster-binding NifX family protein
METQTKPEHSQMKIAICAQSNNVQSTVDSRFGRTSYFAVYDDAAKQWNFIVNNQNLQAVQGAGIQAAQTIIDADANILIACHVGPKAMAALKANNIAVYKADINVTLEQAVSSYLAGRLIPIEQSDVEGHW